MDILISSHRITYTPTDAEPLELLATLDICDSEPTFSGGPETQLDPALLASYATHHNRGNATLTLTWDRYTFTPCIEQAQARGLELWRHLIEHPEGDLLFETAFLGEVSAPIISWPLHASLNEVERRELDAYSTPIGGRPGYHMRFTFTVSFTKN